MANQDTWAEAKQYVNSKISEHDQQAKDIVEIRIEIATIKTLIDKSDESNKERMQQHEKGHEEGFNKSRDVALVIGMIITVIISILALVKSMT